MIPFYDQADIQRYTKTINADGIATESWTTINTIACRITDDSNARLKHLMSQRMLSSTTRKMYCDVDVDIRKGDRVVFEGIAYAVSADPYRPRGFSTIHHQKIYLETIESGKFL